MKKCRIAVLFGGCSSEHEISLLSAACVVRNLPAEKYEVFRLGIDKAGRWFLYEGTADAIEDGSWERDPRNRPAFLSPDRATHGIVAAGEAGITVIPIDVVFPVLHGKNGEDGAMQGLLQITGIPFVGCRALASAVCMDKAVTHTLLTAAGVRQANYLWFYASNYANGAEKIKLKIQNRLGYPIFVKPANAGSSVGITKVHAEVELDEAVAKAMREDSKIVLEESIEGAEVECAVFGNETPEASVVGEIAPAAEFYDYDDKYKNGASTLYIPARLPDETAEEIRRIAARAYRMLGCFGLARVDFFVRNGKNGGEVLLNEINTIPGFTAISMYPKLWEACGMPLPALLDRLVELAFAADNAGAAQKTYD